MKYTPEQIIKVIDKKGYAKFLNGSVNISSVRSKNTTPDSFDDLMYVLRFVNNQWIAKEYKITTDPGLPILLKPKNPKGVLIMKPGQYKGLWAVGKHKGRYTALVQVGNCTVIRDNDKDNQLDFNAPYEETGNWFGANCHKAANGIISKLVGPWSEGCQVHADANRFDNEFMPEMISDSKKYGNSFTYTLLEEKDFEEDVII